MSRPTLRDHLTRSIRQAPPASCWPTLSSRSPAALAYRPTSTLSAARSRPSTPSTTFT